MRSVRGADSTTTRGPARRFSAAGRYADAVRSTDPATIAGQSIPYLTRIAPESENYTPFFGGKVPWNGTPYLVHCPWDYGDGIGRILEALTLVRRATGSDEALDAQDGMLHRLSSLYADDGITYREANPWTTEVSGPYEMRSSLLALVALLEDGHRSLEQLVSLAVDGVARVFAGDILATAAGVWDGRGWTGDRFVGVEVGAGLPVIDALVRAHTATGSAKAIKAAGTIVEHYFFGGAGALFRSDGSFGFPGDEGAQVAPSREEADYTPSLGHFHTRTCGAVGLARYGIVRNDTECISLARRIHDHLMTYGTSFGWFPENLFTAGHEVSELCATLDMIELELLLAGSGQTELYAPAERFVRNHVAVSQFAPDSLVREHLCDTPEEVSDAAGQLCFSEVLPKLSGGFVCVSYPDELYTAYPGSRHDPAPSFQIDISGCCSGSGAKSAYVVWRDTVVEDAGQVRVNFPLGRRHAAVEVETQESDSACQLSVLCHTGKPVIFRVPEGLLPEQIRVNGEISELPVADVDGYVTIRQAGSPGERIVVDFPLLKREERCQAGGLGYQVSWRGSRVLGTVCESGVTPRRNPYTAWFCHEDQV